MRTLPIFVLLSWSCTADPPLEDTGGAAGQVLTDDTDVIDPDSGNPGGGSGGEEQIEPVREVPADAVVTEEGDCYPAEVVANADGAVFEEIPVLAYAPGLTIGTMLGSQADVDSFEGVFGIQLDTSGVDFDRQSILYSQIAVANTCGPDETVKHVVNIDDAIHLSLELWVPDGTCDDVCDMTWTEYGAVVVLKEPNLTACARLIEFCE